MEPKRRGSRTYTINMEWGRDNIIPIVIQSNMSYRAAHRLLDNIQRTWSQMGSKVVRNRSRLELGEEGHKLIVWFEEDKHDKA